MKQQLPLRELVETEQSWFSILWSCHSIKNRRAASDNGKDRDGQLNFLVFYKISNEPDKLCEVQVIGCMTSNNSDVEHFLSVPEMPTENDLQGELFDECYQSKVNLLADLQQAAIKLMEQFEESSEPDGKQSDFTTFYKGLQQSQFDSAPFENGHPLSDAEVLVAQLKAMGRLSQQNNAS